MSLVFQNVRKAYNGTEALKGVSFTAEKGQVTVLLGPNGAGKTTLLNIAVGLLKPDWGEVLIDGINVWESSRKAKQMIGFVSDSPPLYESLTGLEWLELTANLWGIPLKEKKEDLERLQEILELEALPSLTSTFSAGMKRKLNIMGALIHDPQVLIVDEVTSSLDPKGIASFERILRGMKEDGVTIFITTHILQVAEVIADKVVLIDEGKILFQGGVKELREEGKRLEDLMFTLTGGPKTEKIIEYLEKR
ncbi:MAG: ABC transporter ATP-binding protein [Candidatus Korarchaeota archaeon]|nr:ABC transporter ATP-binding protein [Candidatus Korarchaeota archaeon]NIU84554.1 ATP-binding cassette domain-containing protein [Candidatus Thorarchaeota archaeon]NIW14621.1 ATP-binding cassette domain-containing protein [Candidatus Thorarchaeota archaeon]NIW52694.1 ATP-binding cassette domain-containing protein [Candidatus Korarchaeota archaeon]